MGEFIKRSAMLGGIALTALAVAGPAHAQSAPAADGQAGNSIQDIVVTAQRRQESRQSVPIAITAFSQQVLRDNNVTKPQDLNGLVPSLTVSSNGQGSRESQIPTLRGQGATFEASPGVVVYMNEVPLPAATSLSMQGGPGNFIDLENVQVLAGPQGTLFGRNTTGGAVLIEPHKPTDKLEGYIEGQLGNHDLRGVEGMINVPIIDDKLMVRLVGADYNRNGFTYDQIWNKWRDDSHWYTGRLGILIKPVDGVTDYLSVYGTKSHNNGPGMVNTGFNIPGLQAYGFCGTPGGIPCSVYTDQTAIANAIGPRQTRLGVDEFQRVQTWGLVNKTDIALSSQLTLRNIISYQRFKGDYAYDGDGTPLQQYDVEDSAAYPSSPIASLAKYGIPAYGYINGSTGGTRDNIREFTEELQIQGKLLNDKLTFSTGGFYYNQTPVGIWQEHQIVYCPAAYTGVCAASVQNTGVSQKSKALYAQGTLDLGAVTPALDKLKLTAGYRYTWDTIDGHIQSYLPTAIGASTVTCSFDSSSANVATNPSACTFPSATLKTSAPTWTFGLDYTPTKGLLVYGKVSRGYKAGGINPFAVRPSTLTFAPEHLTSYEAGWKYDTRLDDVPVRLNGDVYYSNYSNIQRTAGDYNNSTSGSQNIPASGIVEGIELEAAVKPASWLNVGGTLSYTYANYHHYTYTALSPTVACNGPVAAGGTADASCLAFAYIAPWQFDIHATVKLPVPATVGDVSLTANYSHQSSENNENQLLPSQQPGAIFEPYGLLNLSLDWKNLGGSNFDLNLFMTNVTNQTYRITNTDVYTSLLSVATLYGEPRMFGAKLRYTFGRK